MRNRKRIIEACLVVAVITSVAVQPALACTRVVHTSKDGSHVVTGRNMDWFEDTQSALWVFPRNMKRDGAVKENSLQWVSKYGSVIAAVFDVATTDRYSA